MRIASHQTIDYQDPINWDHPLAKGLVAWWLPLPYWMGGTRLRDLTKVHHGTLTNFNLATAWSKDSHRGGFGSNMLDGTDDYVGTSYLGITGTAARTFACWIKVSGSGSYCITSWGATGGGFAGTGWNFQIESGVIWLRCFVGVTGSWGSGLNDGTWHHVAITFPSGGTMSSCRVFVDGVELSGSFGNGSTALNTTAASNVAFGLNYDSTVKYLGQFSDHRMWSRNLSPAEISLLHQQSLLGYPDLLRRWTRRTYSIPASVYRNRPRFNQIIGGGIV